MDHKQKIGYTILGAGIMLIGMLIDNFTSPPVTAQNDGEITCQKLTFVDDRGTPVFYIETRRGMELSIFKANVVNWETHVVEPKEAMRLYSSGTFGSDLILFRPEGREGVHLRSSRFENSVTVFDSDRKEAASLVSRNTGHLESRLLDENYVRIFNPEGQCGVILQTSRLGNSVNVFNLQGEDRAVMSVNEYGNGAVSTWDKNGYRQ